MTAPTMEPSSARPCPRCQSPCEPEDIRCAVCSVALVVRADAAGEGSIQILRCDDCGAALKYSAERQGVRCAFCGASLRLETPADPVEQAELAVPFSVSPEQAKAVMHAWLGRQGFFAPSDLQSAAKLESLTALWWAAWMVDARTLVSWTADSNAGSGRSDWAPHSGQTPMSFERLVVSASRGLRLEETARLTASTDIAGAQRQWTEGDVVVEQFDAQRSAARQIVISAIEATAADRVQRGVIPGSSFRNVHVAVLLEGFTTRRFLLPSFVLAYRYDGALYRAIVHGQDASNVFGTVPRSWRKILLVAGGILVVLVAIVIAATVLPRMR